MAQKRKSDQATGKWAVKRDAASGQFMSVKQSSGSWKAFDTIHEKRRDAPSKLGELFTVHKQHQAKRG